MLTCDLSMQKSLESAVAPKKIPFLSYRVTELFLLEVCFVAESVLPKESEGHKYS
jgi:hypothetical protein